MKRVYLGKGIAKLPASAQLPAEVMPKDIQPAAGRIDYVAFTYHVRLFWAFFRGPFKLFNNSISIEQV